MSRGFVKEDDLEHAGTDLPERPISAHANYVTPSGLQQLQRQASQLEQERLPLAQRKEDPVAQQRLAIIDRDLRYLQAKLDSAILVDPAAQPADTVLFGATVEVEDENGSQHTFMIVGEDEADIALNQVSWTSPLAQALIGQKIGDSVTWHRPAGDLDLEIIAIHY
ncbi:GreA/GreB family elongation factor [Methylobacillus arboreus]|uniref:GreA/GreB family elongation factor n=1 Tax=Methylobacillus arboreus TaxID=755170 RepID=UPI001E45D96A|nr:GreA/GreB family elongation factor [Methylobacillus arboreus]MCB5191833.1 GreA/GreB family elongation factor [Methylobacillus arboreus]